MQATVTYAQINILAKRKTQIRHSKTRKKMYSLIAV